MNQFSYLLREFGRAIMRNPGAIIGSFLSLSLLLILWNLFWVATRTANNFYDELLTDVRMEMFVSDSLADTNLVFLSNQIQGLDGVSDVQYISRQQAREELAALLGTDLLAGYDTLNPLPRSYVVSLAPEARNLRAITDLESRMSSITGIAEVSYSRQWLEQVESIRAMLERAGLILGAMILLTALISSANAIRLTTRARAVGIQQLRLLGAGKLFVAFPYLLEGLFVSFMAAVTSWLVVLYMKKEVTFTQFTIIFPPTEQIALFIVGAGALGMLSGYLGIRRHLKR